jgi:Protein of unknown function (DUF1592)/Protein of unknown function (DUF1588)/Protein of unknown function (DUF1587)/Protein of unknown function (DUF1595)/Protein of unknown function (DUF1585)
MEFFHRPFDNRRLFLVKRHGSVWWLGLLLVSVTPVHAQEDFAKGVYPVLEKAQCRSCHNDNGVASSTRVQFPREGASSAEINAFGLRLRRVVDPRRPEESLLLVKPTNRVTHAGGERIKRGSPDEKILQTWIDYLAILPASVAGDASPVNGESRQVLRRLTHSQYNHTVRDLLGEETRPADQFPKEDFVHGFRNQAEGQSVSPLLAEAYAKTAERLARSAFRGGDSRQLITCEPAMPGCRVEFIGAFGKRAFRRPLYSDEVARYEQLFDQEKDFFKGAQLVVEAMLQSPHFLFHLPSGPYGVASRLSYFVWGTMPDAELFRAAEHNELNTPAEVEKQVRRLLQHPRAQEALDEFLAQWMRFDRLMNAIRDRRLFPEFTAELVSAMTEETRRLFRSLVWEDLDFREFFTARYTYLSPELAKLYGVPAPREPWGRVEFGPESQRAGVLGQATFLALTSKPAETSPTERGLFVRDHFLCQVVPPPPVGVNTTLPPVTDERPMTTRERLQIHLSNQTCSGCHSLVDPVGFGFEKFDAIGKYREKQLVTIYPTYDEMTSQRKTKPTEYQLAIEAAGTVRGLKVADFRSPRELGEILAREPACQKCVVKMLFRWAQGRPEEAADQAAIDAALERFRNSGFRFRELILAIAGTLAGEGTGTDESAARQVLRR